MTNLCALIEFIQNLCLEDEEINITLKEIDEMSRENIKLENQIEELDREHIRLKIQRHNLESIMSFIDVPAIKNLNQILMQMSEDCIELKTLIGKIDFTKILKCYHMEMEAKCHKEWQPLQDGFVKTLQWHEKMEQRYIVQKYRQAEIKHREAEDAYRNHEKSVEKSLKQSWKLVNQAKERRNNLIVILIKGSKELNEFDVKMKILNQYQSYIENLRQERQKLANQLEQSNLKTFYPILDISSNHNFETVSKPNTEISNLIMPKLPSFADILKSFHQTEKLTNVTSIENTTSICVKSFLHTSTQSTKSKQTKHVHFEMQLEKYQDEMIQKETEFDNDVEIVDLSFENMEIREEKKKLQEVQDSEKNDNEIVNLLTPNENFIESVKKNQEAIESTDSTSNSKIRIKDKPIIQDCIIFKTPFPIQEVLHKQCKESVSKTIKSSCTKNTSETNTFSARDTDTKETLSTTNKNLYDEFLDISSSSDNSSREQSTNKNIETKVLKDFDEFLDNRKNFLFSSKDSNEENALNNKSVNIATKKTNSSEVQDFLDFGSRDFAFDSDDDMMNNFKAGNMDFM